MNNYVHMLGYGKQHSEKIVKYNTFFSCREILIKSYRDVLYKLMVEDIHEVPVYFGHIESLEASTNFSKRCITLLRATIKDPIIKYSIVNFKDVPISECPDKPTLSRPDFNIVRVSAPINRFDISLALLYSWFGWDINPENKAYFIFRKHSDYIPDLFVDDGTIANKCFIYSEDYSNGPESFIYRLNDTTRGILRDILTKYYERKFHITYEDDCEKYHDE